MEHTGITSKAKEVAEKEVRRRIVTEQQAKDDFKAWISTGIKENGLNDETIKFWIEVHDQVDNVVL